MRYIIYSLVTLLIATMWLNYTVDGREIKARMQEPAPGTPRVNR